MPESRELMRALTETTYTHKNDKLILEPKEIVKEKLGFSPDEADAFVLTFAEPVTPRQRSRFAPQPEPRYDPFRDIDRVGDGTGYQPFRGS